MSSNSKQFFAWAAFAAAGLVASFTSQTSAQDQLWVRQFGTIEYELARALAPDGEGGMFVAGVTGGALGGPNRGASDAFLARYDGDGNQLWIRQFGTSDHDRARALAPDGAGGVIATGYTGGDLGGPNAGGQDVFLARYDNDGNRLWLFLFGSYHNDLGLAVAADGAGSVMVAGSTQGDMSGPNAGQQDVFLARFEIDSWDPGDMNCDGAFDGADIDPFFLALGDPSAYAAQFPNCDILNGDMNRDGAFNGADIDPFFACLGGGVCP